VAKKTTKKSKPAKAKPTKSKSKKPAAKPKTAGKRAAAADEAIGRALVTQDEKLYMLFHEDFHARQIFEFLRAETVKDLEQFTPQQIVKLLSQPIQKTVERIRQRLAEKNRHLAGDEAFVVEYRRRAADA
jgi:hypothetical protein